MKFSTLIIGGGISGITTAVELAEAGEEVVLIEKEPYLGGNVSGFNNYFPKLCPPACGLEINYRRIRSNPRISYFTGTEVSQIMGSDGNFRITLSIHPQLINRQCTACGKCAEVCPEKRKSGGVKEGNSNAAYIQSGLAFPMKYTIDPEVCKKMECAKCLEVCDYQAIELDAESTEIEVQAGKIVVATGWHLYDPSNLDNYNYLKEPDVITNLEFEHLLAEASRENRGLGRPSDGKVPGRIAFIQCAGSRDHNHLSYCSVVCCSATIKHALTLAEHYPEIQSEVFYIDLRLAGRNEKLLNKAELCDQITLTRGKAGRISTSGNEAGLLVEVEDMLAGKRREDVYDMVVLAMGMVPNRMEMSPDHIGVELETNQDGFYLVSQASGIVPTACCKRPMDVVSSVRDATSTALKTMNI